jgi:XTP/dITP diphosphohydrolase
MLKPKQIVLATRNQGKVREFDKLLAPLGWQVVSLSAFPEAPEVVEDGATFAENARKKAETISRFFGMAALADDSGLEVDALGGKPGVYSARFAGEKASDEENWRKLLTELQDVPMERRTARFRCVLALVQPGREPIFAEGQCEGIILREPAGSNGFGYDPVFFLPQLMCTMAQLDAEVKNTLSHRAKAMHNLIEKIREV